MEGVLVAMIVPTSETNKVHKRQRAVTQSGQPPPQIKSHSLRPKTIKKVPPVSISRALLCPLLSLFILPFLTQRKGVWPSDKNYFNFLLCVPNLRSRAAVVLVYVFGICAINVPSSAAYGCVPCLSFFSYFQSRYPKMYPIFDPEFVSCIVFIPKLYTCASAYIIKIVFTFTLSFLTLYFLPKN